jgi:hypothetical protein
MERLVCTACRRPCRLPGASSGFFCPCNEGIYVPEADLKADDEWLSRNGYQRTPEDPNGIEPTLLSRTMAAINREDYEKREGVEAPW